MTNQPTTAPQATVTVLEQLVELRVTGQPDVPNQYGSGHIRPTEVSFRYRTAGIRAQVYGHWVRENGELTDAPISRDYAAHQRDMSDWPDWLAGLAREHAPAAVKPPADRTAVLREADLPARIDRMRPEFTEHASIEAIDAQLDRARRQERRWHLRVEWLIGLRQARTEQPATGAGQDGAQR